MGELGLILYGFIVGLITAIGIGVYTGLIGPQRLAKIIEPYISK